MKVYAALDPNLALREVSAYARRVEVMGFDGLHVAETVHDPFMVSALVAEHTERITIRTAVALAFTRSPTLTAYAAWDLAQLSSGRFQLGLGSQIRQNIEDRYGMPWSEPVARLREYLEALVALFAAFNSGDAVRYEGERYRVTRLQPYFNPGPDTATAAPELWLGGVNSGMCELAGELCAGLVTHPTNSDPRFLREVVVPGLERGAKRAMRSLDDVALVVSANVVAGPTDADVAAERERQRRLLAFLYSTPAYAPTLALHGYGDLPARLQAMIRADEWDQLADVMPDELLDALVVCGRYDEVGALVRERFGGLVDGVVLSPGSDPANDEHTAGLVADLQS